MGPRITKKDSAAQPSRQDAQNAVPLLTITNIFRPDNRRGPSFRFAVWIYDSAVGLYFRLPEARVPAWLPPRFRRVAMPRYSGLCSLKASFPKKGVGSAMVEMP
jgi:hypothetical protein